jgi:Antitoxin Phd_YefM, type II toxin-antitoxin system
MRVYSFTEARQNLAEVLSEASDNGVLIKRRNGDTFVIRRQEPVGSPLDVPGISTRASMEDILAAVAESRAR